MLFLGYKAHIIAVMRRESHGRIDKCLHTDVSIWLPTCTLACLYFIHTYVHAFRDMNMLLLGEMTFNITLKIGGLF